MTNGLWRAQLALVWAFGLAVVVFLAELQYGLPLASTNGVYDRVYAPLHDGLSVRGSLSHPLTWSTLLAAAVAWVVPPIAALLAWSGRRALKGGGEHALRDRIRAGTVAAFVIVLVYLTPVGWTLVYGLTRWTLRNFWGEGPDAAELG